MYVFRKGFLSQNSPSYKPIMQLDQMNIEEDLTGESWRQKYWLRFIGIWMQKKNYKFQQTARSIVYAWGWDL